MAGDLRGFWSLSETDASIILFIILASSLLGFWQEKGAADAVRRPISLVRVKATAVRDGAAAEVVKRLFYKRNPA
jgi:magnesium-transporting ATPase (P-type)